MALPFIFATDQTAQMVWLDTNFGAVASTGIIPCTATGTNSIVLTPLANVQTITAYAIQGLPLTFAFVAAATTTGATTIQVNALSALNAYLPDSVTQVGAGQIVLNQFYIVRYNPALNSSAGGLAICSASPKPVQVVYAATGTVATGTTTIPQDNTIPQNTEGDQYMQATITPKSATSQLVIEAILNCAVSLPAQPIMSLFQDSTANALAAVIAAEETTGNTMQLNLRFAMTSGTTSSTTFKIRAGLNTPGTLTVNGASGAQLFGGVMATSITVT